jgi:hypothetical protein
MRLKPRNIKRLMFACTQCGQCIDACGRVQRDHPQGGLLQWIEGQQALQADGSQGLLTGQAAVGKAKTGSAPLQSVIITAHPCQANHRPL